ncbi:hypothetical protein [Lignipirellula cremea]|uniref:Uncharacterized protein n=1 Tax=Lignipirellula cremea TaxID=2528010 RepID=A0A518DSN6_9BACT|nr:hypothetical protein [Lignipirellula cremea]QDU94853.1 hypothetical protein Pla8534_26610 [Lignipirellula cremea]
MPDKFDPYREALVMETATDWPEGYADLPLAERTKVESALHAHPDQCGDLEYVRTHTGFCRKISPTAEEIEAHR